MRVKFYHRIMLIVLVMSLLVAPLAQTAEASSSFTTEFQGTFVCDENDIDLSGIEIKVYSAVLQEDISTEDILQYSENYAFSVYSDASGNFSFERPSPQFSVTVQISTLPAGIGIDRHTVFYMMDKTEDTFQLRTVNSAELLADNLYSTPDVVLRDQDGNQVFAEYTFEPDNDLITTFDIRDNLTLSGVVNCGEEFDVSAIMDVSEIPTVNKIDYLYQNGYISEEEKINAYCDAVLDLDFPDGYCMTWIINEIDEYRQNPSTRMISPDLQEKIEKIFTVPFSDTEVSTKDIPVFNHATKALNDTFTVTYDPDYTTKADATSILQYITSIHNYFQGKGFKAPLKQGKLSTYQIYIIPTASQDGNTIIASTFKDTSSGTANTCSSYSVFYNYDGFDNELKETLAHEYFHMVQYAYNHNNNWFHEASADWAAVSYNSRVKNVSVGHINDYLRESPSNFTEGYNRYGASIVPFTIDISYGGYACIRSIYENFSTYLRQLSLDEISNCITTGIQKYVPNGSFNAVVKKAAANCVYPGEYFSAKGFSSSWVNQYLSTKHVGIGTPYTSSKSIPPLAFWYQHFEANAQSGTLTATVDFIGSNGAVMVVTKTVEGKTSISEASVASYRYTAVISKYGSVASNYNRVTIIPINLHTSIGKNAHITVTFP